ncbi:MAG: hypothetical protein JST53_08140 [Actinobacteria bacterium]|nr:hypothetical protein [Actinomycetota bacterium]
MSEPAMTAELSEVEVPARLRAAAALGRADYEDAFLLRPASPVERTALEWAEAVLESAPPPLREPLVSGWRAIGLDLDLSSADAVLGWRVFRADPGLAVLAAESPLGIAGRLVFERRPDGLLYGTFVRLDGEPAERAWARIESAHPPVVHELLGRQVRLTGGNAAT